MSISFTTTFSVDRTPQEAFDAITDVRGWWAGQIDGRTDSLGEEFTYRVPGVHYCRMRIIERQPPRRVAWRVVDSHLDFVADPGEWTGTTVTIDVVERDGRTQVEFAHVGLVPEYECYDTCSNAWISIVHHSLRNLIATGDGRLVPFDART